MKHLVRLAGLLVLVGLAILLTNAAPEQPMQVTVGAPERSAQWTTYPILVRSAGTPVMAALPGYVRSAALIVNGKTVSSSGGDSNIGTAVLGHGVSGFLLANLRAGDSVQIKERGKAGAPVVAVHVGFLAETFRSGRASGIFYGLLATTVLFQIVAGFALKDPVFAWAGMWTLSVMGIELGRDNVFDLKQGLIENVLLGMNVLAQVGYVGFVATFLKLRTEAPRLLWLLIATNIAATAVPAIVAAAMGQSPPRIVIFVPLALGTGVAVLIALLRRRAGFLPAAFLAVGLLGTFSVFSSYVLKAVTGFDSQFIDRWGIETGCSFDFLVFSLGVAYRARFTQQERESIQAKLHEAGIAAGQDPLTGLLNRRGLDRWLQSNSLANKTLLFIDIDDFKAFNDQGGHATGDDVLGVVGRIIRHAVRDDDAVSRFGGDEYVVVLNGTTDDIVVDKVIARISSAVGFLQPLGPKSDLRVSLSIGRAPLIAAAPISEALKLADADTYRVKTEHHARSNTVREQRKPA